MLLSEIFDHLTHGEFAALELGGFDSGDIDAADYPKVLPAINAALTAIHKRFPLRTKEIIVQQYDAIDTYEISEEYAVNGGSGQPIKYVIDTLTDTFSDYEFMRIEKVVDEDGDTLVLNDDLDCDSLYTPEFNKLQIPEPNSANTVSVIYRANHPLIPHDTADPNTVTVRIPMTYLDALCYFAASRVLISRETLEGQDQSLKFLTLFNQACAEIDTQGLYNKDETKQERLESNGWV